MKQYEVSITTTIEAIVIVNAENEDEAYEKTSDNVYFEEYVNAQVGAETNDDDIEIVDVLAPNSTTIESCEEA